MNTSENQKFNPRDHVINIKNGKGVSEYLEVKYRLVWFRQECPQGTIETEILHLDLDKDVEAEAFVWNAEKRRSEKVVKTAKGVAVFKATIHDGKGGSATGTKSENAANFPDFIEKAESGSIGRALAALGYGTQFAPELNEEHRIVDSPITREQEAPATNGTSQVTGNPQRPNNGIHTPAQPEPTVTAPTAKDVYVKGGTKGLWSNTSGFYAFACAELGVTVSQDTKLTPEQRLQLDKAIDEEAPIRQVHPQQNKAS